MKWYTYSLEYSLQPQLSLEGKQTMAFLSGLSALVADVENAVAALVKADPSVAGAVTSYLSALTPIADAVIAPTADATLAPGTNLTVN